MTVTQISANACLQCGRHQQDSASADDGCVTANGYWTVETLDEWEHHHWGDWTDEELAHLGLHPDLFESYRRANYYDLNNARARSLCLTAGQHAPLVADCGGLCPRCWTEVTERSPKGQ